MSFCFFCIFNIRLFHCFSDQWSSLSINSWTSFILSLSTSFRAHYSSLLIPVLAIFSCGILVFPVNKSEFKSNATRAFKHVIAQLMVQGMHPKGLLLMRMPEFLCTENIIVMERQITSMTVSTVETRFKAASVSAFGSSSQIILKRNRNASNLMKLKYIYISLPTNWLFKFCLLDQR